MSAQPKLFGNPDNVVNFSPTSECITSLLGILKRKLITTLIKKAQDAFQHNGTTLLNSAKLLPAEFNEMAKLKAMEISWVLSKKMGCRI